MKKLIMMATMAIAASTLFAQTNVVPYSPGVSTGRVTYSLPQTTLRIAITVEERKYTPGEFSHYAERYLKITGVSDTEEKSSSITNIEVMPAGVPDPGKVYSVQVNGKSIAPNVQLTKDGILSAINTRMENPRKKPEQIAAPQPKVNPYDYLTEEILMASSTAKMAELTAQEIYSIRESRNEITRGQAEYIPSDGESLKYMIDNLNMQEQALMQMFTGTRETVSRTTMIEYTPQTTEKNKVLFRISDKLGVVDSLNLAGAPVYISVVSQNTLPNAGVTADKKGSKKDNSIRYCVPGRASVRIFSNRQTYFDDDIAIAQFGNIETLSASLLTKSANSRIIFDTATGGILSIESDK